MPAPNHHIILRQIFELDFPPGVDGFSLQQEIAQIVREKLLPRIEALFDRFAAADELIRIDKLELDIGRIAPTELETTLVNEVLKQLEEQLEIAVINRPLGVERLPLVENHFEQWLFFLENGYRPQQMANVPEAMLQTAVLERLASETLAVERFKQLLQGHPVALIRLVRQHPESFLVHLLETLTARPQRNLPDYLREMLQWQEAVRAIQQDSDPQEMSASGLWSHILSPPFFWQKTFEVLLEQPASNWTAENLFVVFLQNLVASVYSLQAPLLVFWRDVLRFKKGNYPLLKTILEHYPELLKTLEHHLAPRKPDLEAGQKTADERWEIPGTLAPLESPLDRSSPTTAQADVSSLGKDQKQQLSPDENASQGASPEGQSVLPNAPLADSSNQTPIADGAVQSPSLHEPGERLSPTGQSQTTESGKLNESTAANFLQKPGQPNSNETFTSARTGDFWYVANAGVILLHPFLSPYFTKAGLLDKRNFVNEAAQHKAVHLLHYLGSGQTEAPEYELVLPRFLCGLPFDIPLERYVEINTEEQAEGEQLLQAAINHWNKLGNTSPGGLREGFLQRDGKLEKREEGWCLSIEQKTIDILLDFLPWNLSIVKLPWIPELLRVEWA